MLQNIAYCPILQTRVAEIKALFQLPATTKDRIFPLILAAPWPNAKELSRTWEKIVEAMGGRRFALDLDRARQGMSSGKEAAAQFDALFDPNDGFTNYYEVLRSIPSAIPVLRILGGNLLELDAQTAHINNLDRGLVVHLEHGAIINPLTAVDEVLQRFEDVTFFVDAGWSNDLLGRELWASQIIERITDGKPEAELVVGGSSFPDSFRNIGARGVIPMKERSLYSNLVRRHNAAHLTYGDWGSTRPRSGPAPMKNIPRLDVPTTTEWVSFRQDGGSATPETYAAIARRVIADAVWPGDLGIWGTYVIETTANELPGAIGSPAVAAAARINIHMHRQAFFGEPDAIGDTEEPFVDI
ncbi:hypothetical protein GCM10023264_08970 [Sphingomonas daechungensis]|uniref:Beta family protein n=1 Tax=Sphingomonas daechungensis TaxID=1176646 RepID=A0ABX6T0E3_9SPHN|nr:beta family protein [Sphingomonas daechungensis]QNP43180.1 beta family protein [Sphingomonas daechungensis]